MTSRYPRLWPVWSMLILCFTVLSSAQTTLSPSASSAGPDSSVVAIIVLGSILVGIGSLFCIGGVCFCCYKKCSDGCYV